MGDVRIHLNTGLSNIGYADCTDIADVSCTVDHGDNSVRVVLYRGE